MEHTNYLRQVAIVSIAGARILRELVLDLVKKLRSHTLDTFLQSRKTKIEEFRGKKKLHRNQLDLLFPPDRSRTDTENWDVTLLSSVLLNVFDAVPPPLQDDIKQLRLMKNELVSHPETTNIEASKFDEFCKDFDKLAEHLMLHMDETFKEEIKNLVRDLKAMNIQGITERCGVLTSMEEDIVYLREKYKENRNELRYQLLTLLQTNSELQVNLEIKLPLEVRCLDRGVEEQAVESIVNAVNNVIEKKDVAGDELYCTINVYIKRLETTEVTVKCATKGSVHITVICKRAKAVEDVLMFFEGKESEECLSTVAASLFKVLQVETDVKPGELSLGQIQRLIECIQTEMSSQEDVKETREGEEKHEWTYDTAIKWLIDHNVGAENYEDLESLEEILDVIKVTKKQRTEEIGSESDQTASQKLMEDILKEDQSMKDELSEIYIDVLKFIKNELDKGSIDVLTSTYGSLEEVITTNMSELTNKECPIVVAGETSAGKSSLLNLLLGADILPQSLLHATCTVCCLHNSKERRIDIYDDDQQIINSISLENLKDPVKELQDTLREEVSSKAKREVNTYKEVHIYWPISILPDRVCLVDTPGVGHNPEMTQKLLNFLPRAVAFIYVINSGDSGGIQQDKLIKIIQTQKGWEMEGKLAGIDLKSTIFVCNQWDRVDEKGEEEVWKDTMKKLREFLPDLEEKQVFKMSTVEAARYIKHKLGHTEKYRKLLEGLEQMMPATLKAKVDRHYRWIGQLLDKIHLHIMSRLNNARSTKEEKQKLKDNVQQRLNKLYRDSAEVKKRLETEAQKECADLVEDLLNYLKKEEVITRLKTWTLNETPDVEAGDFEVTKLQADKKIMSRVVNTIKEWEQKLCRMKDVSQKLSDLFLKECSLLETQVKEVDLAIEGVSSKEAIQSVFGPKDSHVEASDTIFTTREKIILGAAAPLWIPLVTAATILFLPVGLGIVIYENFKASRQRTSYAKSRVEFMEEWTDQILKRVLTKDTLTKFIMDAYYGQYLKKIEKLCKEFIPQQIDADQKQVDIIFKETRTSQEIFRQFKPSLKSLERILAKFKIFKLIHVSKDFLEKSKLHKGEEIGCGSFSTVFAGKLETEEGTVEVALKKMREKFEEHAMFTQLQEIENVRTLRHPNIVSFFGIADPTSDEGKGNSQTAFSRFFGRAIVLVFERCEQSLQDLFFRNDELKCCKFKTESGRHNAFTLYTKMAIDICSGLEYIHDRGYIHRDLKLSNVLIRDGRAKVCDLGSTKLHFLTTNTYIGTPTHMSPEILDQKAYDSSTDIYSLAILFWEMWYGYNVYTEKTYETYKPGIEFENMIKNSRPRQYKYSMPDRLLNLVERCWDGDPTKRPNAKFVGEDLRLMYSELYNEDIVSGQRLGFEGDRKTRPEQTFEQGATVAVSEYSQIPSKLSNEDEDLAATHGAVSGRK